jgi:cold shock CspA family protein
MYGTMLWFNPAKQHGFIHTEEGERLRVDHDGFAAGQPVGDRCRGTQVTFDRIVVQPEEEARAVNVAVLPLFAARRARSRGRR